MFSRHKHDNMIDKIKQIGNNGLIRIMIVRGTIT